MPHPFGLLARGLTVAMAWWFILAGLALQARSDPFEGLGLRCLFWAGGLMFAVLMVLGLHHREKSRVSLSLRPGAFHGVEVSIGSFPRQTSARLAVLPSHVDQWLKATYSIGRTYHDALRGIASQLNPDQVEDACADCRRLYQILPDFQYAGLPLGNAWLPPRDTGFSLSKTDPLIPVLCFSRKIRRPCPNQIVLSLDTVCRLPFQDQHVLTQALAGLAAEDKIPLMRDASAKTGLSIRDDRTAALLMLFRQLQPVHIKPHQDEPADALPSTPDPVFQHFYDLMHEPGRINGRNQHERLGFLHGERLYLHWQAVLVALERRLNESGDSRPPCGVADQLIRMLDERSMLVTTLRDQQLPACEARFKVVFTGKLGEQEHRNEFNDMAILLWRAHFPLMARMRNSRFSPEVMGWSGPESTRSVPPARPAPASLVTTCLPAASSSDLENAASPEEALQTASPIAPELPSGGQLRQHIATRLDALLSQAAKDTPVPVRKSADSEGRVWLYVSLASIRDGLLTGITEAHLRSLVMGETPGVICIKNQKQKRIYGFCLDAIPAEGNAIVIFQS